jgi:peroxiredoxin Q/BCP
MDVGDLVEDFELPDETGASRRLGELLEHGAVVLFFYPAAMTAGCTKESCHFRDLVADFKAVGAQPVGISADPVDKQKQFADKHSFGYPLLSDPDKRVAGMLGVPKGLFGLSPLKRTTFVIGPDRRILARLTSEVRMNSHADRALELLQKS